MAEAELTRGVGDLCEGGGGGCRVFYSPNGGRGTVVIGRKSSLRFHFPPGPITGPPGMGGNGGANRRLLLVFDSHRSRRRGLAHERADAPTGAPAVPTEFPHVALGGGLG